MKPDKGYQRLREHRTSLEGHTYFVTTSCANRESLLTDAAVLALVSEGLHGMLGRGFARLDGYAVMPDHMHLIFALAPANDLAAVMWGLKTYTALRANRLLRRRGAFWQDGYHDHRIRSDVDWRARMEYMLLNPVRAGLVEDADAYPWCQHGPWWQTEKSGPVAPPTVG